MMSDQWLDTASMAPMSGEEHKERVEKPNSSTELSLLYLEVAQYASRVVKASRTSNISAAPVHAQAARAIKFKYGNLMFILQSIGYNRNYRQESPHRDV